MLARVLSIGLVLALIMSGAAFSQSSFEKKPITTVISTPTAYTVQKGELLITIPSLGIYYGITNNLHLGTSALDNFFGDINLFGKYHILHLPTSQIDVAVTAGAIYDIETHTTLTGSSVISWGNKKNLGIHGNLQISVTNARNFNTSTSANFDIGLDLTIFHNLKALAEFSIAKDYIDLDIGILLRMLDILGIDVIDTKVFFDPSSLLIGTTTSIRF